MCYILIGILFVASRGFSQDAANYHVYYEMRHVHTSTRPADTLVNQMLLMVGSKSSYFVSYDKLHYGYNSYQQVKTDVSNASALGEIAETRLAAPSNLYLQEHFLFFDERRHIVVDYFLTAYQYSTGFPDVEWQLEGTHKEILGLRCQKATVRFKGRVWEAWFSPDIPISMGPWLLQGLPGLILEARDETGSVQFVATGIAPAIEERSDPVLELYTQAIDKPSEAVFRPIKQEELAKIKSAARKNRQAFMRAQVEADNIPMMSEPIDFFHMMWMWQRVQDNPINLEDKDM